MRLRFWRRRREALVCRDAVALMAGYLDGSLPAGDRARLESHLRGCDQCTEYLAQLQVTISTLGHVEPEALDEDTLDGLVDVYRRWRADEL